jgi:hypothetical protein
MDRFRYIDETWHPVRSCFYLRLLGFYVFGTHNDVCRRYSARDELTFKNKLCSRIDLSSLAHDYKMLILNLNDPPCSNFSFFVKVVVLKVVLL